jgi:hypothetical protein
MHRYPWINSFLDQGIFTPFWQVVSPDDLLPLPHLVGYPDYADTPIPLRVRACA